MAADAPPGRPPSGPLDRVVVVLVEPLYPGNVGAAARAMKNCGLSRLVVVAPPAFDAERARWMAPGAHDVLEAARFVGDLDAALVGVHRAVASTARHRKHRQAVWEPEQVAAQVVEAAPDAVTAILFGREDHGLDAASVERCESILRIPTAEHASLNLSQAVLLVSHALFQAARRQGHRADGRPVGGSHRVRSTRDLDRPDARDHRADLVALEPAVDEWVALLDRVGYTRGTSPDKVRTTARGLVQRGGPTRREVDALRGMASRITWALDHPELDPRAPRRRKSED